MAVTTPLLQRRIQPSQSFTSSCPLGTRSCNSTHTKSKRREYTGYRSPGLVSPANFSTRRPVRSSLQTQASMFDNENPFTDLPPSLRSSADFQEFQGFRSTDGQTVEYQQYSSRSTTSYSSYSSSSFEYTSVTIVSGPPPTYQYPVQAASNGVGAAPLLAFGVAIAYAATAFRLAQNFAMSKYKASKRPMIVFLWPLFLIFSKSYREEFRKMMQGEKDKGDSSSSTS